MKKTNSILMLMIAAILGSVITILVVQFVIPPRSPTDETDLSTPENVQPTSNQETDNIPAEPELAVVETNAPPDTLTNQVAQTPPPANSPTEQLPPDANVAENVVPVEGATPTEDAGADEEEDEDDGMIQLSFQNAQMQMVLDWLGKTTGKSIIPHQQANGQITIMNSKEMPVREAINLVYSALSLQNISAVETATTIYIVPAGQEPKINPQFVSGADQIPEGRQKLLRIFSIENTSAGELRERLGGIFSSDGEVEVDGFGNRLIVTDYTDNIRLLEELIPTLDTASDLDSKIEIYPVKYLEADELANLLNLVLSGQAAPTLSSNSRSSSSASSRISLPPGVSMPAGISVSSGSSGSSVMPSGEIRFWPDNSSNRLIVSAPQSEHPKVEELIATLDTEKPADVNVRTLPLQYINAVELVREIGPLYRRMGGSSLKDVIEVAANARSNSLVILSSESNFNMIRTFIQGLDSEVAQEKVLRTFVLENASAVDVADRLIELTSNDGSSRVGGITIISSALLNGALQQPQITADERLNMIMVQAAPSQMAGIEEMIQNLDAPLPENSVAPQIYPLSFIDAFDLEEILTELFVGESQSSSGQDDYYRALAASYGVESDDTSRLYGKIRVTSATYSNAVIVTASSEESLKAVEDVIKKLDMPSDSGESTIRVPLKFAKAIDVANNLNILFARGGSPPIQNQVGPQNSPQNQGNPNQNNNNSTENGFQLEDDRDAPAYFSWLGGQQDSAAGASGQSIRPPSDLIGRVRAVPDKRSNSILLTANVHYLPQVLKLVKELDEPTFQVLLEAKIVEVSTDFRDRFGVRWSPDGDRVFDAEDYDGSFLATGSADYEDTFISEALRTGVLNANINLDLLIQFLKKNTDATVVGEPLMNVADNQIGKLFVGAQVPFVSNSVFTDQGNRNDTFEYREIGVILEVTPQINDTDEITLKIRAESSNIRNGETLFGGAIYDTRSFRTEIVVRDGETAVIGGIIQTQDGEIIRKVPLLGDIPILGWAFKKKDSVVRNVELMVFLRPSVMRSEADSMKIMNEIQNKTPRLQEWELNQEESSE